MGAIDIRLLLLLKLLEFRVVGNLSKVGKSAEIKFNGHVMIVNDPAAVATVVHLLECLAVLDRCERLIGR